MIGCARRWVALLPLSVGQKVIKDHCDTVSLLDGQSSCAKAPRGRKRVDHCHCWVPMEPARRRRSQKDIAPTATRIPTGRAAVRQSVSISALAVIGPVETPASASGPGDSIFSRCCNGSSWLASYPEISPPGPITLSLIQRKSSVLVILCLAAAKLNRRLTNSGTLKF
jgi:hypothetical protein